MLSYKQKRIIYQILPFSIIPALFSAVHVILEKGVLGDYPIYPSTGNPFDSNILISFTTSFFIGTIIGVFEVFYVNIWFQNRSFYQKLLFKSIVYTIAIVLASFIIIVLGHSISQKESPFSTTVLNFVLSFFTNFVFWSIVCYYSLAIIISLFYKEVSDNMGQSVFFNFFTGKYHRPKVEHRTFMFVDMKSSTSHAEKLGHITYFQMLKDYYNDISKPILEYGGEIYQYVGDEIVITWKVENQFAHKVLDCFFAMKKVMNHQHQRYFSKYGLVPDFKAGIHYGKVTTGEIGLLKKDIVFTGDTLNTTARIQGLCNQYEEDLLISDIFKNAAGSLNDYLFKPLGEFELKGRNQRINLFSVTLA